MNSALKNTLILLVILTLAFVGYYIFVQKDGNTELLSFNESISPIDEEKIQEMLDKSNTLKSIVIDTSVFEDGRFRSYENISQPIEVQPVGNDNPFNQRL